MLSDWEQKKIDEEKMLKDYTNPNDKRNANIYVEKLHHKEIESINTNFKYDNHEVTESISSSMKYLMRKKLREKSKPAKIEKLEIGEYNDKKIKEHNNFNFEKFKEDVQSKMNNSYSIFCNNRKVIDKQPKLISDDIFKSTYSYLNGKHIMDSIKNNQKEYQVLNPNEEKVAEIDCKEKKDIPDNLSQLSDDSENTLDKEDLEKELLEF